MKINNIKLVTQILLTLTFLNTVILFSFNMIVAREPFAGVLMSDGNWTGMIGQLSRGVSIAFGWI